MCKWGPQQQRLEFSTVQIDTVGNRESTDCTVESSTFSWLSVKLGRWVSGRRGSDRWPIHRNAEMSRTREVTKNKYISCVLVALADIKVLAAFRV